LPIDLVVGVDEGEDAAKRGTGALVAQRRDRTIRAVQDACTALARDHRRLIRGVVVDDENLNEVGWIVVGSNTHEAAIEPRRVIAYGDYE
jgi:hypothetical protein